MRENKKGVKALAAAIGTALIALVIAVFVAPSLTTNTQNAQASSVPQTIKGTCKHVCTNPGPTDAYGTDFNVTFLTVEADGKTYTITGGDGPHRGHCIDPGAPYPGDVISDYEGTWNAADGAYDIIVHSENAPLGGQGTHPCQRIGKFQWKPYGNIEISKDAIDNTDAMGNNTNDSGTYNYAGIKFNIKNSDGTVVETLTTNAQGYAKSGNLLIGQYTIEEVDRGDGKANDWFYAQSGVIDTVNVGPGQVSRANAHDVPVKISINLTKGNAEPDLTAGNKMYSLAGAEYTLTNDSNGKSMTVTTNNDGYAEFGKLLIGNTYTLKETKASPGMSLDKNTYKINAADIAAGGEISIVSSASLLDQYDAQGASEIDLAKTGWTICDERPQVSADVVFSKKDGQAKVSSSQGNANLSGMVMKLEYYDSTDDATIAKSQPKYTWYAASNSDGTININSISSNLVLNYTINGHEYELSFKSDPVKILQHGEFTHQLVLPIGTLKYTEVLPPRGYLLDNNQEIKNFSQIETSDKRGQSGVVTGTTHTIKIEGDRVSIDQQRVAGTHDASDRVKRGDLLLKKTEEETNRNMDGVPFVIESNTTGEKHLVITDPDGIINTTSSWNAHSNLTNGNDKYLGKDENGNYIITGNESDLDPNCGIWFTGFTDSTLSAAVKVDDSVGALPYDTYTVTEVLTSKSYGHNLITKTVEVTRDVKAVPDDTWLNSIIKIGSLARDSKTGINIGLAVGETANILDQVSYENVTPGKNYEFFGKLVNKDTGAPILDAQGKEITKRVAFTAEDNGDGAVDVSFEVPVSVLDGTPIVCYEYLYDNGQEIAKHAEQLDANQTVYYPLIHTTALDTVTGAHEGSSVADKVTVKDEVAYSGLKTGIEYKLTGTLMDKKTGEAILDENGNPITKEQTFTPEESEGTIDIEFEVASSIVAGKTTVAFESLYYEDTLVGIHADIDDEGQTVYFPNIHTTATDGITEDHEGLADGEITLNDEVAYENLENGAKYTLTGVLMDKATNEPILDENGDKITATTIFIARDGKGEILSTSAPQYEDLTDIPYGIVKDITGYEVQSADKTISDILGVNSTKWISLDEIMKAANEKLSLVKIKKEATKDVTDDKSDTADNKSDEISDNKSETTDVWGIILTPENMEKFDAAKADIIAYVNVRKAIDNNSTASDANASDNDTPSDTSKDTDVISDRVSGTVTVSFVFDASVVQGKQTVVFEDLYRGVDLTTEANIARHADINDEGQEVDYPDLHTTAAVNGDHTAQAVNDIELIDTVSYTNLEPGKTYRVEGVLMNKNTGESVKNTDGESVTASSEFVPESENGEVQVTFHFDASGLANTDTVVFENLYKVGAGADGTDTHVGKHEDLDDADQTVHFNEADLADILQTGDVLPYTALVLAAVASVAAGVVFARRKFGKR